METEKPQSEETTESAKRFIFLLLKWVFKVFAAVLLVFYVSFGLSATTELYKRNQYRTQDVSYLIADIDEAAQSGDSKAVTVWLRSRPFAETDKLVGIITPKSAGLSADVFFEIAHRQLALGRPEEALFWLELGRFRLLYDIIRCGGEPGSEQIFDPVFKHMHSQETDDLLRAHPELLKKIAQRVLDFDDKYPAHDNPVTICKAVTPELPAEEINWEGYRQLLRKHTEEFLKSPDKVKPAMEKKK